MAKKMIDVVKQARQQGLRVGYEKRQDGGIRVTSINGKKFSAGFSEGNTELRRLTGNALSRKEISQRLSNQEVASRGSRLGLPSLSKTEKKYLQRINNYARREAQRQQREQKRKDGLERYFISRIQFRQSIHKYGIREARLKVKNSVWHKVGLAYEKNVEALIDYLNLYVGEVATPLVNYLKRHKMELTDSALMMIYNLAYDAKDQNLVDGSTLTASSIVQKAMKIAKDGAKDARDIKENFDSVIWKA